MFYFKTGGGNIQKNKILQTLSAKSYFINYNTIKQFAILLQPTWHKLFLSWQLNLSQPDLFSQKWSIKLY
jgi:hypothetical protein